MKSGERNSIFKRYVPRLFRKNGGRHFTNEDDTWEASSYTYYPNGLTKRRTWARVIYVDYEYSLDGLVTKKDYSDDTPDVTYRPEECGREVMW